MNVGVGFFVSVIMFVCFQALDSSQSQFDREMLLQGKNISDEEFKRLMEKHQREQLQLQSNFETEKERQRKAMKDKVHNDRRSS